MFCIVNPNGKAHGLFGWTRPEFGLQYRSKEEAEAVRLQSPAFEKCTIQKVAPKPPHGTDPNGESAIFGYRSSPRG